MLLLVVGIRCGIKIYIYMGSRLASYIGGLSTKIESPYVERIRSGYHVAASASEVPGETSAERFLRLQKDADDDGHESGESEELETDSSSEDSADEEFQEHDLSLAASAENEVVPAWSQFEADVYGNVVDAKLVRHRQSTMYHLIADEGGTHLKCGRTITSNFDVVQDEPKFVYPMCTTCFGTRR